ncbi:MAG: endolytic transglycosylase MltG [Trueperaceae bacterium]
MNNKHNETNHDNSHDLETSKEVQQSSNDIQTTKINAVDHTAPAPTNDIRASRSQPVGSTTTFTKTQPSTNKKIPGWLRFLGVLFLLMLLAGAAGVFYIRQQLSPMTTTSTPTEFEVQAGWGAKRVASELESSGLIRNARVFSVYLSRQGLDRNIGEGLYDLDPAMRVAEIARELNEGGRPRIVNVVIPEGFRMKDIAATLGEAGFDSAALLELFQNPTTKPVYVEGSLEGYLFPASYDIPMKSTPEDIAKLLLERFAEEVTPPIETALRERSWTISDWVTLASVVQAEAANAQEMPIIAGVFLNRLDEGMPLQSDPTVAYGLGKDLPELDRSAGDFESDHPWNSYTRTGLPETPINNPGRESLMAVLESQRTNDAGEAVFFFMHGVDAGQPVFKVNTNFDDHLRDVNLYLR